MDLQLAWRNVWRNPRRTMVILTAVVIGVWSMVFTAALMRGTADGIVKNNIATLTGHIQIHQHLYPDDPVVDYRIARPDLLEETLLRHLPEQSHWSSRVRVSAVANNARHNAGVILVGIEPPKEARLSFIGTGVTQGEYLQSDDKSGILIGQSLAERFETRIGRKLILMSQDTNGDIASRAFRIRGIFQAEMELTEKVFVFVHRSAAQEMLRMGATISEVAVLLPDHVPAGPMAETLTAQLANDDLTVRSWKQILSMITAILELYDTFILIWFLMVFVAMAFGIVNTTLMAVFERMREFGLLKALGMRPRRIVGGILTESSIILTGGMLLGSLLGLFSCWLLSYRGIDLSALAEGVAYSGMSRIIFPQVLVKDLVGANVVILILGLLVSLYPAIKAARFTPVEAMTRT